MSFTTTIAEGFLKNHESVPLIVFTDMALPVGTTKNLVKILEALSSKILGKGFHVAYIPEITADNKVITIGGTSENEDSENIL